MLITKVKFMRALMWLTDSGILDKVKNDVLNPPIPIPDPTVRRNQPLILRQLGIIMIILVVGLAIGTIVFLIELCIRSKPQETAESTDGIKLKERNDAMRPTAASPVTPVVID